MLNCWQMMGPICITSIVVCALSTDRYTLYCLGIRAYAGQQHKVRYTSLSTRIISSKVSSQSHRRPRDAAASRVPDARGLSRLGTHHLSILSIRLTAY